MSEAKETKEEAPKFDIMSQEDLEASFSQMFGGKNDFYRFLVIIEDADSFDPVKNMPSVSKPKPRIVESFTTKEAAEDYKDEFLKSRNLINFEDQEKPPIKIEIQGFKVSSTMPYVLQSDGTWRPKWN